MLSSQQVVSHSTYAASSRMEKVEACKEAVRSLPFQEMDPQTDLSETNTEWDKLSGRPADYREQTWDSMFSPEVPEISRVYPQDAGDVERYARILISSCATEHGRKGLQRLCSNPKKDTLLDYARWLLPHTWPYYLPMTGKGFLFNDTPLDNRELAYGVAEAVLEISDQITPELLTSSARFQHTFPVDRMEPILKGFGIVSDKRIFQTSTGIIGGGPTAAATANAWLSNGFKDTVVYSKDPRLLGIWGNNNIVSGGHNTFKTVSINQNHLWDGNPPPPHAQGRPGQSVVEFINGIVNPRLIAKGGGGMPDGYTTDVATHVYPSNGAFAEYVEERDQYRVTAVDGATEFHDTLIICTGNSADKPINYGPMKTNADNYPKINLIRQQISIDERHDHQYVSKRTEDEYTRPVIVGFGNSALHQIKRFMAMQQRGVKVQPIILTHYSMNALLNPEQVVLGSDGKPQGPIFRRTFDLGKIQGDIKEDREVYWHAVRNGWIVPDVKEWNLKFDGPVNYDNLFVEVTTGNRTFPIRNIPKIFALIGSRNDYEMLTNLGCKVDPDTLEIAYDPWTGRVEALNENDPGRMYVAGAAAIRADDRNPSLIPGTMRMVRNMFFDFLVGRYGCLN